MKDFDFLLEEESSDMNCQICSYENNDYLKTVVAFANTNGGKLLFGLDERKREIIGIDDDSLFKVMDTISKSISNYCELEVLINIYVRNYKNKYLIIVEIPKGALKPYYIKGNSIQNSTYIRKNGITSLADTNTIKELILDGVYSAYLYQTSKKIKHSVTNKPRLDDTNDTKNVADTNRSSLAHDTNDTKNVDDTNRSSLDDNNQPKKENLNAKIISLIRTNPEISQKEICNSLNLSLITIKRLMQSLQSNGVITRKGSKRRGKWVINILE